jgi:hypothetical protein
MCKKIFLSIFLSLSITTMLLPLAFCGSSYVIGRGDHAVLILRIEVVDEESQWPIENADIILSGGGRNIASLSTDDDGVAVLLVKDKPALYDLDALKVRAQEYKFSEKSISLYDLDRRGIRIGIPTQNWEINDSMIVRAVKSGDYKRNVSMDMHNRRNVGGFVEIRVELEKIPEKRW